MSSSSRCANKSWNMRGGKCDKVVEGGCSRSHTAVNARWSRECGRARLFRLLLLPVQLFRAHHKVHKRPDDKGNSYARADGYTESARLGHKVRCVCVCFPTTAVVQVGLSSELDAHRGLSLPPPVYLLAHKRYGGMRRTTAVQ